MSSAIAKRRAHGRAPLSAWRVWRGAPDPTPTPLKPFAKRSKNCSGDDMTADATLSHDDIKQAAADLETQSAEDILQWAAGRFAGRITFATSLGIEDCVVADMIARGGMPIDLFTLDTELLFPETYALWKQIEQRYGITIAQVKPERSVADQAAHEGAELWLRDPDRCCVVGRTLRPDQGESAGALDVRPGARVRERAPGAVQPAARPELSEHRMRPLHEPRDARRRSAVGAVAGE
jgi:hypothetical protein